MAEQELREWAELSRSISEIDRVRHAPPPMVWDNIVAAVAADELASSDDITVEQATNTQEVIPPEAVIDLTAERGQRAPSAGRRQRRNLVLAAAASVLVFLVGLSFFTGGVDEPTVIFAAEVSNDTLPEPFDGTASAVIAGPDAPVLEIDFEGALPSDEPVELWLIKPDAESGEIVDMRSLGIVNPDAGQWTGEWPSDLDPKEYSLVDLSIEPDDGDPTHSGRSILRGQLAEGELVES